MPIFRFFYPIEVRYGDLDPQGHVNNARYLTYFEQGRIAYVRKLGLWSGGSFLEIGFILADAHVIFRRPVCFGQDLRLGVRVTRLGGKSMTMEYSLQDASIQDEMAAGSTVLVAYDYHNACSVNIPAAWKEAIAQFEHMHENPRQGS